MLDILESLFNIFSSAGSKKEDKGFMKAPFIFLFSLLIALIGLLIYLSYNGGIKHAITEQVKDVAKAQAKEYVVHKKDEVKEKITESKVFNIVKHHKEEIKDNSQDNAIPHPVDATTIPSSTDIQPDTQKDYKPSLFDKAKFKAEQKWQEHKDKKNEEVNVGS